MRTEFVTSQDGTRLRAARWGEAAGSDGGRDVLIVHGLAEHADRYAHVGTALAARGWAVTMIELRGHGHSGGRRGHVLRWAEYHADLRAVADTLRPGFSVIAHSMGGLVTLDAVISDNFRPARIALSNPLLGLKFTPPRLKVAAAKVLSKVWPSLALKNELKPEWLSRDLKIGEAYAADPLVFDTATPRWYTEMLSAWTRVHAAPRIDVPFGMFVGDADPITDADVNQSFARKHNAPLTTYPQYRHEIFNEIGKEGVIAQVAEWLEK